VEENTKYLMEDLVLKDGGCEGILLWALGRKNRRWDKIKKEGEREGNRGRKYLKCMTYLWTFAVA
jgi:hypothetical protein